MPRYLVCDDHTLGVMVNNQQVQILSASVLKGATITEGWQFLYQFRHWRLADSEDFQAFRVQIPPDLLELKDLPQLVEELVDFVRNTNNIEEIVPKVRTLVDSLGVSLVGCVMSSDRREFLTSICIKYLEYRCWYNDQ